MTTRFDRVRPRTAPADGRPAMHDSEGKRALFSSSAPEPDLPGVGSVQVECNRCGERTLLSPTAALRAAFPSLVLSLAVGRGDKESTLGIARRRHGAFLRCPACGRASWARVTIRL